MEPKKRAKGREWKKRPKVHSNISKDFPWEVVLRFLQHPRSLIMLQMVDKNLYHLIKRDHKLWLSIFKREIFNQAYCVRTIKDPLFPELRLLKSHLHGFPVYAGPMDNLTPNFSNYVRRVFALQHGTRCGMCGCRYKFLKFVFYSIYKYY
jgi:hypothetical protein